MARARLAAAVGAALMAGAALGVPAARTVEGDPPHVGEGARRTPVCADPAEARVQIERGDAAFYGRGVKQDYKAARAAYAQAAGHGQTAAMPKRGEMHASGIRGPRCASAPGF